MPSLDGELFAGYDPGGKQSYAAFVIVKRMHDKLYMVHRNAKRGDEYTPFNIGISEMNKKYAFKLLMDDTGLGGPIAEQLKDMGVDVEGLTLSNRTKEELLSNLKILMEQKNIVLPVDLELHNSLNAIEYEKSRTGGYKFYKRNGTYDDLGFALALACFAAKREPEGVIIKV